MQPYPRTPGHLWPGHLHGTGCPSAPAMDTWFPTVVWCLCSGLGFRVTPPFLAAVSAVYVWVRVSALPRHSWFRGNPAISGWGLGRVRLGTGFGFAPPILAGVCGACVRVWGFPAPCYFLAGGVGACVLLREHRSYPDTPAWGGLR